MRALLGPVLLVAALGCSGAPAEVAPPAPRADTRAPIATGAIELALIAETGESQGDLLAWAPGADPAPALRACHAEAPREAGYLILRVALVAAAGRAEPVESRGLGADTVACARRAVDAARFAEGLTGAAPLLYVALR